MDGVRSEEAADPPVGLRRALFSGVVVAESVAVVSEIGWGLEPSVTALGKND